MKSLREIQGRYPEFERRTPDLPPFRPLEPGEDPPRPGWDWTFPVFRVAGCAGLVILVARNAREAALALSR